MKFTTSHDFNVDLDTMWRVFTDASYPEKKYLSFGALAYKQLRHEARGNMVTVELLRTIPVNLEHVPSAIKRLISPRQDMRHLTQWERISDTLVKATIEVDPIGKPVMVYATGNVEQLSSTLTRLTLNYRIEASVPLIGGKLAELFAVQIQKSMEDDYLFTRDYITQFIG